MNFGRGICNKTPDVKLLIKSILMSQLPPESVTYNEINYNNKIISYFSLSAPCLRDRREPADCSSKPFCFSGKWWPQEGMGITSLCCNGFSAHSAYLWCILGLEITFPRELLRSEPIWVYPWKSSKSMTLCNRFWATFPIFYSMIFFTNNKE